MKLRMSAICTCAVAFFIAGAAPVARHQPTAALEMAALQARAVLLQRAWAAGHPGESPHAMTEPAIKSGTITTPTVSAQTPEAGPGINVTFKTGISGLDSIELGFTGPTGQFLTSAYSSQVAPISGTIGILEPNIGPYTAAGTYSLSFAYISDAAGNTVFYNGSQLAALFPSITFDLTNSNPSDTTPPMITAGKIATPTVKLSAARPVFEADLTASDDVSGISSASMILTDPNGVTYYASGSTPAPITQSATFPIGLNFRYFGTPPTTGIWTITSLFISDYANNDSEISDAATLKSLFGKTTFKVTK